MDLNIILEKTKEKTEKITNKRIPAYVAKQDRPYDVDLVNRYNQTQSEHKTNTNITQTPHKSDTKFTQINGNLIQIEHKINTQPNTDYDTNLTQNRHITTLPFNTKTNLSLLVGLQRSFILFIYSHCKANRSHITDPLTVEHLASTLKCKVGSIKTTIQRLLGKRILLRTEFKSGRGGWAKYELPEPIYHEILQLELLDKIEPNLTQTQHKDNTQSNTQPNTSPPSSSSYINKNTTTELPEIWRSINMEPLREIGFSENQLRQLASQNLNKPDIVQESIYHFAFGLEHNKKTQQYEKDGKAPLNILMGVLRKGQGWFEINYRSAEEIAQEQFNTHKIAAMERRNKLEDEAYQIAFEDWKINLSQAEVEEIAPLAKGALVAPRQIRLKIYFKENIWPQVRKDNIRTSYDK